MGWPGERQRHSMSARGIETNTSNQSNQPTTNKYTQNQMFIVLDLLIGERESLQNRQYTNYIWKSSYGGEDVIEYHGDKNIFTWLHVTEGETSVYTPQEMTNELPSIVELKDDHEIDVQKILEARGVKDVFNKKGLDNYIKEDNHWNTELAELVKKHDAKAAIFGKVVTYENYIPLFRPINDASFFKEAEPNTIYVWNMNDLPEPEFEKEAAKVRNQFGKDKTIELIYDPGGA